MVAFSCCVYDGGKSEQLEMELIREKGWGEKFKRKEYVIAPDRNRINGRCPMTPLEVSFGTRIFFHFLNFACFFRLNFFERLEAST